MLSENMKSLLERVSMRPPEDFTKRYSGPNIEVNVITSKAGSLYEKMRYLVDYKDEHTIRRAAIERILKRMVTFEDHRELGKLLLEEMVSVGYLENDTVPLAAAHDVQGILNKYLLLSSKVLSCKNQVWSLAASEIERFIYPHTVSEAIVDTFYGTVESQVHPRKAGSISQENLRLQTYIACRRSLLKEGRDELFYALFIRAVPKWNTSDVDQEIINDVAGKFHHYVEGIGVEIDSAINWRISGRLKNHAISFGLIRDIVERYGQNAQKVLEDSALFKKEIFNLMSEKNYTYEERIRRSGTRAIIYILITKILIGMLIEFPYELLVLNNINYLALGTNIIFHPLLLFLMVKTIKYPNEENTERIVVNTRGILGGGAVAPIYIRSHQHGFFQIVTFTLFYLILAGFSFGTILSVLLFFHFNIVSIGLFLFFLAIVSFFGLRIRHKAKHWALKPRTEKFSALIWHFLTLPLIQTGQWLSVKLSTINIFIIFFDVILETPFKALLRSFDAFVSYLRDTKDDLA